jgi:hypothetical protein
MLASYLFFLLRRPISGSNLHYLASRIAGLQSLCPLLDNSSDAGLHEVVDRLRSMQPANFLRTARAIQFQLTLLHQPPRVPTHYIVSGKAPERPFAGANSLLIALGPAIGIGDETILFPLPAWLHALHPDLEVVVLSGYRGLWDRVAGVDRREYYSNFRQLLEAMRGELFGRFDVVLLADFEKPGLIPHLCCEPSVSRYIEISLGGQCVGLVDNITQRIHLMTVPPETGSSYYHCLELLLDWLGVSPRLLARYSGVIQRSIAKPSHALRVFVSPFTSKHDPSMLYWSKLLSSLTAPRSQTLEFVLDTGASLTTERFSSTLRRAASARAPDRVSFQLASDPGCRTLSLEGVFRELERCDAAICADSFAAHAGPLFGCTTLVIARSGLEKWRTPFEQSFYFDIEDEPIQLVRAMQSVLDLISGKHSPATAWDNTYATALDRATRELAAAPPESGPVPELYDRFVSLYDTVVNELDCWPIQLQGLLHDVSYQKTWRDLPNGDGDREAAVHLTAELNRWQNTNLRKFLGLAGRIGDGA